MAADNVEHSTSERKGADPRPPLPGEAEAGRPEEAFTQTDPPGATEPALAAAEPDQPAEPAIEPRLAQTRATPQTPRPRSPWLPLAVSIVTGAAIAVGGAFGLRSLEASKPSNDDAGRRIEALSERASVLEQKIQEAGAASKSALSALDARLSAVATETGKFTVATKSALSELERAVAARPAETREGSSPEPVPAPDLAPIETRLGALEHKLGALEALEQKLGSLETQLAATKAEGQKGRETVKTEAGSPGHSIAIVAESLLDKIQRGVPFTGDLSALENLGVGAGALASLKAHAAAGVPSARSLAVQFAPLVSPILAAEPAREHESFIDELTRSASRLVHVHRDDAASGEDAQGLVDQIQAALAHHDVEDAFAAWTRLPAPAKARSQAWGEAAKTRLDALAAARAIQADAVTLVAKPKS